MPLLFYGKLTTQQSRMLYSPGLQEVRTSIFDSYKIEDLAPVNGLSCVALFWHFTRKNHSAISWHEDRFRTEQTVWLPGLLSWREALELSREEFPTVIPSPIVFRRLNDRWIYNYD